MPNIHPVVVHFPIALFATAVLCDGIYLVFGPRDWLDRSGLLLHSVASVTAVLAAVTGKLAESGMSGLAPDVAQEVAQHGEWAFGTVVALVLVTWLRFEIRLREKRAKGTGQRIAAVLAAGLALFILWQTAARGGALVFRRGVGVVSEESRQ